MLIDRSYRAIEADKEKRRLIIQMGSTDNALARQAAGELTMLNHTHDGSLRDKFFTGSDLEGVTFLDSDMQGVRMTSVNLNDASLIRANLDGSHISFCQLINSHLWGTSLKSAVLICADLDNAEMFGADFRGAYLYDTSLRGAILKPYHPFDKFYNDAQFDETTLLPDESYYQPELGLIQLDRFIHPDHPEYWEPEWVKRKREAE